MKRFLDFLLRRWYVPVSDYDEVCTLESNLYWRCLLAEHNYNELQKEYREKTSAVAMDEVRKILREERGDQKNFVLTDAATMAANHVAHQWTTPTNI